MKNFNIVQEGEKCTLTIFDDEGGIKTVPNTFPRFADIRTALFDGDDETVDRLLGVGQEAASTLTALSERVSIIEDRIFFDGDPLRSIIAEHIVAAYREEGGQRNKLRALVNFLEKVQTNPNEHSREHLYRWAEGAGLTIMADGDFIAYKGVNKAKDGTAVSVSHGTAWVNGEKHTGAIPNRVGDIVTMPRSDVQHDPAVACSTGLHAGTWDYASSFGSGGTLLVKINPRDVVSTPTDCESQKVRVCRYEVLEVALKKIEATTYGVESDDDYDEEEDDKWYCVDCGEPCDKDAELCDECEDALEPDEEWYNEDEDEDEDESPAETTPESKPQQQSPKRGYSGWGWGIGYI